MATFTDARGLAAEARRRLGQPPELSDWPLVSIVVLNRDGAERLRRLLAGLIECTDYPRLELILVDNASRDESLQYVRAVEAPFPISILANAHNESFADACNQGAALAAGQLLLFLNNDAEPFELGWLRELVDCLRRSGAAAVGPTLLQPAEPGAAAPYVVHQRGLRARTEPGGGLVPAYRDHLADPLGDGFAEEAEVIALAAACLLVDRAAFERVGGFSHGYWYGPEDVDLALKLREAGFSVRCSGRSLLVHPPGSTLNEIPAERRREWTKGSGRLFAERWAARLRREYELDRLRGGGLWAEPERPGPDAPADAEEELEALSFCLESGAPPGEDGVAGASLDALAATLRRHGHRCLVLRGAEIGGLDGLDCDVAVHLRGPCRYAPNPAQLNVLWEVDDSSQPSAIERAHYDLAIDGDLDGSPEAAQRFAERLLAACQHHAEATGFKTRIEP